MKKHFKALKVKLDLKKSEGETPEEDRYIKVSE
jgi:hypothetical protein